MGVLLAAHAQTTSQPTVGPPAGSAGEWGVASRQAASWLVLAFFWIPQSPLFSTNKEGNDIGENVNKQRGGPMKILGHDPCPTEGGFCTSLLEKCEGKPFTRRVNIFHRVKWSLIQG